MEWKLIIWIPYKTFRITFLSSRHIIGNNEYLKPSLSFLFVWKFETKLVMLMRKILPSFLNHPTLSFEKTQALEKPISNATAKSSNFSTNWYSKSSVLCVRQVCRENGEQLESGNGFIPWWRLLTAHWAHSCWGGHKKNQNQFVKYLHQKFLSFHTHTTVQ